MTLGGLHERVANCRLAGNQCSKHRVFVRGQVQDVCTKTVSSVRRRNGFLIRLLQQPVNLSRPARAQGCQPPERRSRLFPCKGNQAQHAAGTRRAREKQMGPSRRKATRTGQISKFCTLVLLFTVICITIPHVRRERRFSSCSQAALVSLVEALSPFGVNLQTRDMRALKTSVTKVSVETFSPLPGRGNPSRPDSHPYFLFHLELSIMYLIGLCTFMLLFVVCFSILISNNLLSFILL